VPILLDSIMGLPESLKTQWTSAMDAANSQRAQWRDALAYSLVNPGKGSEGDPQALATHEGWMSGAAEGMSENLRPEATKLILDLLGIGNEGVSGSLSWLGGNGFYGPAGYDQADIDANRRGIVAGLLKRQQAPPIDLGPFVPLQGR